MKHFFKRALLLVLLACVVTAIFTISGSIFISLKESIGELPPGIANNSYMLEIESKIAGKAPGFTNKALLAFLKNNDGLVFAVYRANRMTNGMEVYYSSKYENKVCFAKGNAAAAKRRLIDNCIYTASKYSFVHNNLEFFVADTLDDSDAALYYVDMEYVLNEMPEAPAYGMYYIAAGDFTYFFVSDLVSLLDAEANNISVQLTQLGQSASGYSANDKLIILGLVMLGCMLFVLNSFSIINYWQTGKRRELFVRKMAGASNKSLIMRLCLNAAAIELIGFVCGTLISIMGILYFSKSYPEIKYSIVATAFSFALLLALNACFLLPLTIRSARKNIIDLKR